ncbi:helix-turn-helix domain-containing protein [Chachezhania sediminis]|uniref:helix-turn-helix domain-containing protein n=1 Tax=Chachezhania sediminis TaxID=2599291 RepID=UPI00131D22C1|nr:helix-turn-helix domain-containing protein [Chachezhania sediminis]
MIRRKPVRESDDQVVEGPKGFDDYDFRIGDVMRGERATRGKSLLDVQRELRIKATYIAAVENADPSAFDTPGFIAGYVRSYARYLDLDPDYAFQQFCKESGFSVSHGMSERASSAKAGLQDGISRQGTMRKDRDPFGDPDKPFAGLGGGRSQMRDHIDFRAIGSSVVLLTLIGGLVFGGWTLLRQVQQVQLAPLDQAPVVLTDLDPLNGAIDRAGAQAMAGRDRAVDEEKLSRIYRPQALDVPVLVSRDAPIASLDPNAVGTFRGSGLPPVASTSSMFDPAKVARTEDGLPPPVTQPQVVEAAPEGLRIVAVRDAWMRITAPDGSVLFSATLKRGDHFDLPPFEGTPKLRTGASDGAYFEIAGTLYGPVGNGTVVSDVNLTVADVQERYSPANPNRDADLKQYAMAQQLRTADGE